MKRLILMLTLTALLTGCADITELGDRAIIQLAAIDYSEGEYTLNALLFSAGGSGGVLDVTQTNVIKVTGSGDTLGDAVQSLSLVDGKDIYMSETKLIVLGKGFEQTDISSVLTMLYRDMRCSLNTPICYAESAELLTDLEFTEGITAAEKPVDMIENAFLSGVSPKATLLDVLADVQGGRSTLIPCFAEDFNGSGMTKDEKGRTAVLSGSRVITSDRLGTFADSSETAGVMLLSDQADSITLNFSLNGKEYSCEAYRICAGIQNAKPKVSAYFRTASGAPLSEEEEQAAYEKLVAIVEKGVKFSLENIRL